MIEVAIISALIGAALGLLHFKVYVLVPAMLVVAGIVATVGTSHSIGLWQTVGATVLSAVCVQMGYLIGTRRFGNQSEQTEQIRK